MLTCSGKIAEDPLHANVRSGAVGLRLRRRTGALMPLHSVGFGDCVLTGRQTMSDRFPPSASMARNTPHFALGSALGWEQSLDVPKTTVFGRVMEVC